MTINKKRSKKLLLQTFLAPIIYAFISIKLFPPIWICIFLVMLACVIYYTFRRFQKYKRIGVVIKSFFVSLFVVILSFVFIRFFCASYYVKGPAMASSLNNGDRIVADQTSYVFSRPARGDIIVFTYKNIKETAISRIVGLPGETIEIKQGKVYINDQPIQEDYVNRFVNANEMNAQTHPPTSIPARHYFMLGDNRLHSMDSRTEGPISQMQILAKITGRFYPFDEFGVLQSPAYRPK